MKPQNFRNDPNLSLSEKLKRVWSEENKINIPKWPKFLVPSHVTMNRGAQSCLLIALFGISGWGVTVTIPYLYNDTYPTLGYIQQVFGSFLLLQMMINLLCIRYVDTAYNPADHGGLPETLQLGQIIDQRNDGTEVAGETNGQAGLSPRNGKPDSTTVAVERKIPTSNESLVYVATGFSGTQTIEPKRTAFPYWSWVPCVMCNKPRPPRCHHCTLCNKCVLKRDHHCYFAGACIGYQNMRHFFVFLFWASVATTFATVHFFPYFYYAILPHVRFIDIIPPFNLIRAVFGFIEFKCVMLILLGWLDVFFMYNAIYFLLDICTLILSGLTSFEKQYKMKVCDTKTRSEKIEAVFGRYWLANFLIPLHFVYRPLDDPVHWPDIRSF